MNLFRKPSWLALLVLPFIFIAAFAATLSTTALTLIPGEKAKVTLSSVKGTPTLSNSNTAVVSASLVSNTIQVTAKMVGSATLSVKDKSGTKTVSVTVKAPLSVSPTSLTVPAGQSTNIAVSNATGAITLTNSDASKISATLSGTTVTVKGIAAGGATLTVRDTKTAVVVPVTVTATTGGTTSSYTLVAWNDLGMHCMDSDYSVFSILPPYNNLHAQLVNSSTGKLVTSGVSVTYEATADPDGSMNSISSTKTNFWQYAQKLFGAVLEDDVGLAGNRMASGTPQPLSLDSTTLMFKAEGIPITPLDNSRNKNTYPLVKVVARDSTGKQLATARVVLPVSDEMSCTSCHASTTSTISAKQAARPVGGWVNDGNVERDYRRNILRLHDEKSAGSTTFTSALAAKGYDSRGLLATADSGHPILCASCHASNALQGTGLSGIKPLTEAMHAKHSMVIDPSNNLQLDSTTNRNACYQCHPGSETKCLRGAMSGADMQCQSCHGKMSNVGKTGRVGWLDQPNCQACHYEGQRQTSALLNGVLRKPTDTRFATNPNTPSSGFSLYRMSKGHGGLQCEACHGATHAEYSSTPADPNLPRNHYNDNLLSQDVQGHAGTVSECSSCHKSVPLTTSGGPHGMHTLGQTWVKEHHDRAKGIQSSCAYCHGADYRGSLLSTAKATRTFSIGDGRSKSYSAGQPVGCYDCHNGPTGG